MSDGITDAYKKVDHETQIRMDLRYIKGLVIELEKAIRVLEQTIDDK